MNEKNIEVERWVETYSSALLSRAKYLISDRQDAEDIVQDVFIAAFESHDAYKGDSQIKTWLMSILKYKVADYYRRKYKTSGQMTVTDFFDEKGSWKQNDVLQNWNNADDELLNDNEFRNRLNKCIDALPEKWMMLVTSYYLEEKKADEICQETGITTTNLWKILQRSRMQLRKCLEVNWFSKV